MVFIQWYNLYRRRYPPKDEPDSEVDIQDLTALDERCKHIQGGMRRSCAAQAPGGDVFVPSDATS
jgi:hypothetical protein